LTRCTIGGLSRVQFCVGRSGIAASAFFVAGALCKLAHDTAVARLVPRGRRCATSTQRSWLGLGSRLGLGLGRFGAASASLVAQRVGHGASRTRDAVRFFRAAGGANVLAHPAANTCLRGLRRVLSSSALRAALASRVTQLVCDGAGRTQSALFGTHGAGVSPSLTRCTIGGLSRFQFCVGRSGIAASAVFIAGALCKLAHGTAVTRLVPRGRRRTGLAERRWLGLGLGLGRF
jgi:hypothetical protein